MERYSRNLLIEGFGESGQQKLKQAKVLVIGCGGLGSPVLLYLAAAGVGTLGMIDNDVVDITNLQRQILHFTNDLGKNKTDSANEKLHALNPEVKLNPYSLRLNEENAREIINDYDFIVDCSDNYSTKFLINDCCVELQKPYSHGSVVALQGEVMTWLPGHACYRCMYGDIPDEENQVTSLQVGILGAMAGMIGTFQAIETIKYITGIGDLLIDKMLMVNAKDMIIRTFNFGQNSGCVCCRK